MTTLQKALSLFSPRERRQAFALVLVGAVVSLFDVLGIASLVPFLSVLANDKLIATDPRLNAVYEALGFTSHHSFLLFLAAVSFALIIVSALVRSLGQYAMIRFIQMRRHTLAARLLEGYLRQPYEFFLDRNSSDLGKKLLAEVDHVLSYVLIPLQTITSQGVALAMIVTFLLFVNPWVAIVAGGAIAGSYGLIYLALRDRAAAMGRRRKDASNKSYRAVGEVLGGIKSIKLMGNEQVYLQRFERATHDVARYVSANLTLSQIPRYSIEAIAFGGILLISIFLIFRAGGTGENALGNVVPLLGIYAFSGYRMLPAIQQVYQSFTQLRFGKAGLDELCGDVALNSSAAEVAPRARTPLPLRSSLRLEDVRYSYPGAETAGIYDLTLELQAGATVGIVGATGAGKTTLVDVILGLLPIHAGRVLVDGVPLTNENVRSWQANIGYVPQDVFLLDASIAANIAMGVPQAEADMARVRNCARLAQIDDFIERQLPEGYETRVGERGVRLSGGQKQRIAIARALYREPSVLVFDEATSALDNLTEQQVMKAIGELHGSKTIIMIAHRLSTVRDCDQIVLLERGRLIGSGPYDELLKTSAAFERMVRAEPAHEAA